MLISLHGGHVVEHVLQQEKAPFLLLGGIPTWMLYVTHSKTVDSWRVQLNTRF